MSFTPPTRVVHCKKSRYNVYIGRPSPWGNPWSHKGESLAEFQVETREQAVDCYRRWLKGEDFTDLLQDRRAWILEHLPELEGMTLGCWCGPKQACHGKVLVELLSERGAQGAGQA